MSEDGIFHDGAGNKYVHACEPLTYTVGARVQPGAVTEAPVGDIYAALNDYPLTFTTEALCGNVWVDLSKGPVYWTARTGWYTIGSDGLLAKEPEPQTDAEQLEVDDFRAAQHAPWVIEPAQPNKPPTYIYSNEISPLLAEHIAIEMARTLGLHERASDMCDAMVMALKAMYPTDEDKPPPVDYFAITRDVSA